MKQFLFNTFSDKKDFKIGAIDRFEFEIPSLRISLISNCNEKCFYCHNEGISSKMPSVIQTGDIINAIYSVKDYGLRKVKFTGGEPLLFKDLKNLLYSVKHVGDMDIFITTNGALIKKRIKDLSPNIISKISVSLDTLSEEKYKFITDKSLLNDVLAGLELLGKNGYKVEIDNLLLKGLNTDKQSLKNIINYCIKNGFDLQFIELSDKTTAGVYDKYYVDPVKTLRKIGLDFNTEKLNDRKFFKINGIKVTLCRSVKNLRESSAGRCSGLRLLPNGYLKDFFYE
ncbi:MAG: radical SAM protein [Deltaproteobacteria bacterium]|nr:radical SAM protein [Deltaproteobacteria bacterium]